MVRSELSENIQLVVHPSEFSTFPEVCIICYCKKCNRMRNMIIDRMITNKEQSYSALVHLTCPKCETPHTIRLRFGLTKEEKQEFML